MPFIAYLAAIVLAIILFSTSNPWLALVALVGPTLAWILSVLGISGAAILTFLSAGGAIPMVAGIGFIVTIALAIYSYFM